MPFSVHAGVDHPLTLYAATKRSNELMAHAYAHLYGIPVTGLRFFTVYGPWGRPDMALFLFTKAILAGDPIDVFNHGEMQRDFTYIDDIVDGIVSASDAPASPNSNWRSSAPDPASSLAPFKIYNIGNSKPTSLLTFIKAIEKSTGRQAVMRLQPLQAGDVPATWADITDLTNAVGYRPKTPVEVGVPRFVKWYRSYYGI
jgi:UDP-glucuronate 4-epimerase